MHRGYIALYRRIQEHPFYKEPREFSKYEAWVDLLMEAQHNEEPQRVIIGMNVLECHYGECLRSIKTWSMRWMWSRSKVFRFLKLLKKMDQIHYTNETVTTRIKIINYERYDPRRNGYRTQLKQQRNASETQSSTDKNVKNVKNDNMSSPLTGTCQEPAVPDPPDSPKIPPCPHQKIIDRYHIRCPELSRIKVWDEAAEGMLRARWRSSPEYQSVEWWDGFFENHVATSSFLMGRVKKWRANLRWLVKSENFSKVMNGDYIDRGKSTGCRRTDHNLQAAEDFINDERIR